MYRQQSHLGMKTWLAVSPQHSSESRANADGKQVLKLKEKHAVCSFMLANHRKLCPPQTSPPLMKKDRQIMVIHGL